MPLYIKPKNSPVYVLCKANAAAKRAKSPMFGDGFCVSKNCDKGLDSPLDKVQKMYYTTNSTK